MITIPLFNRVLATIKGAETVPVSEVEISVGATDDNNNNYNLAFNRIGSKEPRPTLEDLEYYGTREPLTRRGTFLRSKSLWGQGFEVVTDDKQVRKECLRITRLPKFKEYLLESAKHQFIYNDGYLENIWNDIPAYDKDGSIIRDEKGFKLIEKKGDRIIGFGITDPKSMIPKWNEYATVTRYEQQLKLTSKKISFDPKQFTHIVFDRIADNIRGLGLVEPLVPNIHTVMMMSLDSRNLIHRMSVPFVHLVKKGLNSTKVPKYKLLANSVNSSNSLVSNETLEVKYPGKDVSIPNLTENYNMHINFLSGGLGVPLPILLQNGEKSNKASLDRIALWNYDETRFFQEVLSTAIEDQIFATDLKAQGIKYDEIDRPQVIWNPINDEVESSITKNNAEYIKTVLELFKNNVIDETEKRNLIRKKLHIDGNKND